MKIPYIKWQWKKSICSEKVLAFASPRRIRCNKQLAFATILTPLEEKPVSPRMDFSQIGQLRYNNKVQIGLIHTIIDVLSYLDQVWITLPRCLYDSMTIAIILKRKFEYINSYLLVNVWQNNVIISSNDLCNTLLYENEGIFVNNHGK